MATLLKVLNNLADINRRGVLHFTSELRLPRQTVMVGQLDHRASQQLQCPAGATFGRARTGGGDEEGFFVAGQLAIGACPRLFVQGGFEIAFNEAALGPVNGRAADSDSSGNIVVAEPAVSGEQNLGSFDLAGVMLAAAHQRGEFTPLGLAQFDMVAYVHPGLLANRDAQTNQAMNQLFGTCPRRFPRSQISKVSTWPSSTPTVVSSASRRRKPTCSGTSKSRHPACTRWCSPSNAPASSDGPRASRAASSFWLSPRTSQSSVELQTVKTSVQRN